ncbi:MAG: hypothetical protein WCT19_00930 [Candidatus Paceibacterota bacterium]
MSSPLNKISATFFLAFFLAITVVPTAVFSESFKGKDCSILTGASQQQCFKDNSLIPCGFDLNGDGTLGQGEACDFNSAVTLVTNIISWLIYAGTVLSVIAFIYVGWIYLSAGGDPGKIKDAKTILWKVIWGFVIMVAAWLIIKTIETTFIGKSGIESFLK